VEDKSAHMYQMYIEKNAQYCDRSIFMKMFTVIRSTFIWGALNAFIHACTQLAQPILLKYLIVSINENDPGGYIIGKIKIALTLS
jgi:hypothetical protein